MLSCEWWRWKVEVGSGTKVKVEMRRKQELPRQTPIWSITLKYTEDTPGHRFYFIKWMVELDRN